MTTPRSLLILLLPLVMRADHLPDRLIAAGPAEHVLCGIDVYRTKVAEALERLGTPISDQRYPKTEEAREIVWAIQKSKIHATVNVAGIVYAVDVTGKAGQITRTGRGLSPGQRLDDLKRIYGPRFRKRGNAVTLQWRDGTEMRAVIAGNRIVSLELIAQVE